ncbi:hypothetical protein SCUP234_11113 [Seiridium cupressi]
MRELTDADFASNPLGGPAFFEAVVDDQGGRETRHGPVDWSDVEDWLNLTGAQEFPEVSQTPSQGRVSLRILAAAIPHAVERIKLVIKVANKITIGYEALSVVFDLSNLTIRALERDTGFGVAGFLITAEDHIPAQHVFKLDSALIKLQSQQTELAILSSISRFSEKLADFLLITITKLDQALRTSDHDSIVHLEDEILHMLELPHNQAQLALSQIQSLKERLQSQTDLIFNLISSEENKISRLVAEESAKVAVASRRDSVAMKTVAVLTMIFLPGTFVAAFLSMPLFEWNVETGGYPSSTSFQWIYWVITLPLTIALMVGWRVWWRMEERSWSSELEEAKQQNRHRLSTSTRSGQELTQMSSDQTFSSLRARNLVARGF